MPKHAPDFTKIFFDSLGGAPAAITYPLRDGPNLPHDLAFMSSLLHDARVLNPGAQASDGTLEVRFNRDCWELGFGQPGADGRMHTVDSVLTCHGVFRADWRRDSDDGADSVLDHCWISRMYRADKSKRFAFELVGFGWLCHIRIDKPDWSIELRDQSEPREWSPKPR